MDETVEHVIVENGGETSEAENAAASATVDAQEAEISAASAEASASAAEQAAQSAVATSVAAAALADAEAANTIVQMGAQVAAAQQKAEEAWTIAMGLQSELTTLRAQMETMILSSSNPQAEELTEAETELVEAVTETVEQTSQESVADAPQDQPILRRKIRLL